MAVSWTFLAICFTILQISSAQVFRFNSSIYVVSQSDAYALIYIENMQQVGPASDIPLSTSDRIFLPAIIPFVADQSIATLNVSLVGFDYGDLNDDQIETLTISQPTVGSIGSPSTAELVILRTWGSWGDFSTCSATCGEGERTRTRECINPQCIGASSETEDCNIQPCFSESGQWGSWGDFSTCSVSCGGGQRTRNRTCTDGNTCTGSSVDTEDCNTQPCFTETWGSWGDFSTCSASCGEGQRTRSRECIDPQNTCTGSSISTQPCNTQPCPIVTWSEWGPYAPCSTVLCGIGTQTRTRTCSDSPQNTCVGSDRSTIDCGTPCGEWELWGTWGGCTKKCDGGRRERTRVCIPRSAECLGSPSEPQSCNTQRCPEWSAWIPTGDCSQTCGGGTRLAERTCLDPNPEDNVDCIGSSTGSIPCSENICPDVCDRDVERTPYGTVSAPANGAIGSVYESSVVCPWYTRNDNSPIARATCVRRDNDIVSWVWEIQCGGNKTKQEQIRQLSNMEITDENAALVIALTAECTRASTGILQAVDVCNSLNVLDRIAGVQTSDIEITNAFVNTVSNLFDADTNVLDDANDMNCQPSDGVQLLEDQLNMVDIYRGDIPWPYRVVTDNVAAEVFFASKEHLYEGIYAASSDRSDEFGSSNTFLTLERSNRPMDVEIEIPDSIAFEFKSGARVAISAFANNRLLRSTRLMNRNSLESDFNTVTNSRVISATVGGREVSGLADNVMLQYRPLQLELANNSQCVFWEFRSQDWVTDGCRYVGTTPDGTVKCECNHLTNFAILMDIYGGSTLTPTQDYILEILSYVGCCLSIIGLVVTLITYCSYRKLRMKKPNQILISLCSALLGLYLVFIVLLSIDTERDQTEIEKTGCSILAGILHYFTLASIFWMTVEAYNMYLMFIKVVNSYVPRLLLKASIFAWGGPLLVVGITAGVARHSYARTDFCFLQMWPLIGGVLIPIGLLLIFNMTVFVIVMIKLSRDSPGSKFQEKRKGLRLKRARNAIMIMTLMGLTWAIGYLSIIRATTFFSQLLFCLFNAMQGYVIFMMYCVQQPTVRNYWRGLAGTIRKGSTISSKTGRSTRDEFIASNRRTSSSAALVTAAN